jgi:hypothetical protein
MSITSRGINCRNIIKLVFHIHQNTTIFERKIEKKLSKSNSFALETKWRVKKLIVLMDCSLALTTCRNHCSKSITRRTHVQGRTGFPNFGGIFFQGAPKKCCLAAAQTGNSHELS